MRNWRHRKQEQYEFNQPEQAKKPGQELNMIRPEIWPAFIEYNLVYHDGIKGEKDRIEDCWMDIGYDFVEKMIDAVTYIRRRHAVMMYSSGFSNLKDLDMSFETKTEREK